MLYDGGLTKKAAVLVAGAALVAGGLALTSARAEARGWGRPSPEQRKRMRAEMHRRFLERRAKLLRREVGLSEAKARQVERLQDRFHKERRRVAKTMHASQRAIEKLLNSDSNDQAAYRKAVQGILAAHEAMSGLKQREMRAVQGFLTPKEQAGLMVAFHKARRRLRRFAWRHWQGRDCARGRAQGWDRGPMGPPPGGFGPPPGDEMGPPPGNEDY